jgi:hypothetical protein
VDALERAWCRNLGHLPRIIYDHPTNPAMTRERCLRCGARVDRSRETGVEREVRVHRIEGDRVTFFE